MAHLKKKVVVYLIHLLSLSQGRQKLDSHRLYIPHPRLEYSRSVFQKQFSAFLSGSFRSGLWQEESEAQGLFSES